MVILVMVVVVVVVVVVMVVVISRIALLRYVVAKCTQYRYCLHGEKEKKKQTNNATQKLVYLAVCGFVFFMGQMSQILVRKQQFGFS